MLVIAVGLTLVGFIVWCWLTIRYMRPTASRSPRSSSASRSFAPTARRCRSGALFWLRNVVNGLLGIIPLYGLIEVLFIFGEARQCLHDKLADTIVVKA